MTATERDIKGEGYVRLIGALWPKWKLTEELVELIIDELGDLDEDSVKKAMRAHRLERSSVPDLKVLIAGAKQESERIEAKVAASFAPVFESRDEKVTRGRVEVLDDGTKLWLWRYCRNAAVVNPGNPREEQKEWPKHWCDEAPPLDEWPSAVVREVHHLFGALGRN